MSKWFVIVEFRMNDRIEHACRQVDALPFRVWSILEYSTVRKLSIRLSFEGDGFGAVAGKVGTKVQQITEAIDRDSQPISVRIHPHGLPEELPDLVGLAEVAKIIGVSRQRAKQIADTNPRFPKPLARPLSGPLYPRFSVEAWHADREQARGLKELGADDFESSRNVPFEESQVPPQWLKGMLSDELDGACSLK